MEGVGCDWVQVASWYGMIKIYWWWHIGFGLGLWGPLSIKWKQWLWLLCRTGLLKESPVTVGHPVGLAIGKRLLYAFGATRVGPTLLGIPGNSKLAATTCWGIDLHAGRMVVQCCCRLVSVCSLGGTS